MIMIIIIMEDYCKSIVLNKIQSRGSTGNYVIYISITVFQNKNQNILCFRSSSFGKGLDPRDISGHVDRHTRMFMDADTDKNRYWALLLECPVNLTDPKPSF